MYVHLGEDTTVNSKNIVAIIDLDNTTVSKHTRNFLASAEKNKNVFYVTAELPKSAVICEKNGKNTVYISQLSPTTLQKRLNREGKRKE